MATAVFGHNHDLGRLEGGRRRRKRERVREEILRGDVEKDKEKRGHHNLSLN